MSETNKKKSYGAIGAVIIIVIAIIAGVILLNEPETDDKDSDGKDQEPQTYSVKDITTFEAAEMIQNRSNDPEFVILDVRTPDEFSSGHIENASHLDYYSATFAEDLDKLDKNKTYLVYCRTGSRSRKSADMMIDKDFKNVYNMLGGIVQWEADGYDLVL